MIRLLATQQPMARDLRLLIAAMKIANDLERVGDHAVNIAQSAERLLAHPADRAGARDRRDGAPGAEMLADALEAFVRADPRRRATSAAATTRSTPCTTRCSASC